jgi:hypothetical protein
MFDNEKILNFFFFYLQFFTTFDHFLPLIIFYLQSFYLRSLSTFNHSTFDHSAFGHFLLLVIFHLQSFYIWSFYPRSFYVRSFYVRPFYVQSLKISSNSPFKRVFLGSHSLSYLFFSIHTVHVKFHRSFVLKSVNFDSDRAYLIDSCNIFLEH